MENTDEKMLEARISDILTIAGKAREHRVSNFLDPGQQKMAEKVARSFAGMAFYFDGGWEEAERKVMVAFPDYLKDEPFHIPLGALRITPKDPAEHPGHRDFLGAILGLGIAREKLGDILVTKTGADVIAKQEIIEYIGLNLVKVGSVPVSVEEISLKELFRPERSYKEMKSTVASLRIDAVASLAFGISRSKMAPFIKGENLKLNFKVVKDPSTQVREGDVISASRLGRAKIVEVGGQSKKGRIYVKVHKYIS